MWKDLANCMLVILLLLQIRGGECLQLIRLSVPSYKMRGESAFLECDYDLEGNTLYAVKWYKDNEEFYRYVPRSSPPQYSYVMEGVRVNMEQSNAKQVVLRTVNLKSIGDYRCEVSAEKPRFVSVSKEARMEVIYFPAQSPTIVGADERPYSIGEELKLNCSSAKAHPTLDLDWYINDVKVPEIGGSLERHKPIHVGPHKLFTSQVTLRLRVLQHYLKNGQLRLKCVASLPPSLFAITDKEGDGSVSPLLQQREALLTITAGELKLVCALPLITLLVFVALQA